MTDGGAAAAHVLSLDGDWNLSSDAGHRLTGSVPGDLSTDLEERGRIVQDPLYELGFMTGGASVTNCRGCGMRRQRYFRRSTCFTKAVLRCRLSSMPSMYEVMLQKPSVSPTNSNRCGPTRCFITTPQGCTKRAQHTTCLARDTVI